MAAYTNSSRALAYLTERAEDLAANVRGLVDGAGSSRYLETGEDKVANIQRQLDSNRDEEKLDGLKRLVALISKGRDVSAFLAPVLKCISTPSLEIRKLVYIFLLRYAEAQPDLALLSVNSFQRDLADPSPLIRAMALRVLSGIRVRMVAGITAMSIGRCAKDPNPYVRKIAALAIPKCFDLDHSQLSTLITHLSTLLADRAPSVLGAALVAFSAVCPDRWELLHPHYRKLCHALADIEEWGQAAALDVLARYARACFADPDRDVEKRAGAKTKEDDLSEFLDENSSARTLDRDHELLLAKSEPLLCSRNPAVVMAVIRLFYYVASSSQHTKIARPLIRLLHNPSEVAYLALLSALLLASSNPALLSPYITSFFVRASDPSYVARNKLRLLTTLASPSNAALLLCELSAYVRFPDDELASDAVRAIGAVAACVPEVADKCLAFLLSLLKGRRDVVVAQAVLVIKSLIQARHSDADPLPNTADTPKPRQSTAQIVARLAPLLFGPTSSKTSSSTTKKRPKQAKGAVTNGAARASIFWQLGQYARLGIEVRPGPGTAGADNKPIEKTLAEVIVPDVLRRAALNFSREDAATRLQIVTLATKLYALLPTTSAPSNVLRSVGLLQSYILQLARYDTVYDVRDRARFCKGLLAGLELPASTGEAGKSGADVEESPENANALTTGPEITQEDEEETQVSGVRLRREQVLLILFEGKPAPEALGLEGRGPLDGSGHAHAGESSRLKLGSLSLAVDGRLVRGWTTRALSPWASPDSLPPSSVREPSEPAHSTTASGTSNGGTITPRSLASGVALNASTARSFSNETWNSAGAGGSGAGTREKVVLVPTESGTSTPGSGSGAGPGAARKGGWKDLDEFLEESSESEEEEEDDGSEDEVGIAGREAPEDYDDDEEEEDEAEEEEEEDEEEDEEEEDDEEESEDDEEGEEAGDGLPPRPNLPLPVEGTGVEWAS